MFLLCLYVVLSCVGRGLCDGLITCPEESYRVSKCTYDHRNPKRGPMYLMGTTRKIKMNGHYALGRISKVTVILWMPNSLSVRLLGIVVY
jgi:hypothetical protein